MIHQDGVHIDAKNLKFLVDQINTTSISGTRYPLDYMLVFSDTYTDSSNKLTAIFGNGAPPAKAVNFRAYDITNKSAPKTSTICIQ